MSIEKSFGEEALIHRPEALLDLWQKDTGERDNIAGLSATRVLAATVHS